MYSDSQTDSCSICHNKLPSNGTNRAIFDCGHKFHLTCVLHRASYYNLSCPSCVDNTSNKPSLGNDRMIAIQSNIEAKILARKIKPEEEKSFFSRWYQYLNPFKIEQESFKNYMNSGYPLSEIQKAGYTPEDAIQENIPWTKLCNYTKAEHLLTFGFKWQHMLTLGIKPFQLSSDYFTWTQLKHSLNINAREILKMNINIQDLADLNFTPHQLNDLGFTWDVLLSMGGDVKTLSYFNVGLEDLKTYWNPTQAQWYEAGFYDKSRVIEAGWDIEHVTRLLPELDGRLSGRTLRLQF